MLIGSWHAWLSPLTDSGRELDLPLRLLRGELLYRDVHYLYAPFSPYFNSVLYRLFGISLDVLQLSGILAAALLVLLAYRISRRLLDPPDAALAASAVIVWLVFRPHGNLISPYAYAALHAAIFALAALLFALRHTASGSLRDVFVAGFLAALAAVTKLEFALPAAAAVATAVILRRPSLSVFVKRAFVASAPVIAMVALVYGLFLYHVGWETLVVDCHVFYTHLPRSLIVYNSWRAGTDRPFVSIIGMLGGLAVCMGVASGLLAAALISSSASDESHRGKQTSGIRLSLACTGAAALICAVILLATSGWDGSPLRAAPLLMIAIILYALRDRAHLPERVQLLVVAVFSLVIVFRVILRVPSGGSTGAFLLPTTYVVLVYLLTRGLPVAMCRWGHSEALVVRIILVARMFVISIILLGALSTLIRFATEFRFEASSPRGNFRLVDAHHPAYQEALDYLRQHSLPGDRIAVFPEGSDLAFFSERKMPLRHQILLPGLVSAADERRMIAQLSSEPVRYVLIVNRATREFGAEVFGRDFYQDLGRAIRDQYHLAVVCGKNKRPEIEIGDSEFFIKILERNP